VLNDAQRVTFVIVSVWRRDGYGQVRLLGRPALNFEQRPLS
jgi:hypothetical protein